MEMQALTAPLLRELIDHINVMNPKVMVKAGLSVLSSTTAFWDILRTGFVFKLLYC